MTRVVSWWCLGGVCLAACPAAARADDGHGLVVFAAASLRPPLTRVAEAYTRQTGIEVKLNFGSSGALARQIEAGAQADVFLSADPAWLAGVGGPTFDFAANRLVVVTHRGVSPAERDNLLRTAPHVVVGDPAHVPVGHYARQSLMAAGIWSQLQSRVVLAQDAAAAARMVRSGQADVGIVYATQADADGGLVVVSVLPSASHDPINYRGVVCREDRAAALAFVEMLTGSDGRAVLHAEGYAVPDGRASAGTPPPDAAAGPGVGLWSAAWLSLKVAAVAVLAILLPGTACGWLLARRRFPGAALLEAVVHLPLVMPPVVVGYAMLILLGRGSFIGRLLESMGVHLAFTWLGAALAAGLMAFPLLVRSVKVAVELVDRRLEQAAATLGASPVRVACTVTLPLAAAGMAGGVVLAMARAFGEFGATITFAGNVDGQTRTLPLAIYSAIQSPGGDGQAMALAGISAVLALGSLGISEWALRRARRPILGTNHDRP